MDREPYQTPRSGEARKRSLRLEILVRDDYVISRNDSVTREGDMPICEVYLRVSRAPQAPSISSLPRHLYAPRARTGHLRQRRRGPRADARTSRYVSYARNECVLARGDHYHFINHAGGIGSQPAAAPRGTPGMRIN